MSAYRPKAMSMKGYPLARMSSKDFSEVVKASSRLGVSSVVGLPVYIDADALKRIVWPVPEACWELVVYARKKEQP